jgi:alpha-N-arabinofuranosidase
MDLTLTLRGFDSQWSVAGATELVSDDLMAVNSPQAPDRVAPRVLGTVSVTADVLSATLAPASWNVIELRSK